MIPILTIRDGRQVFLEGDSIQSDEALEIAQNLIATWGGTGHSKIKLGLVYIIEPNNWVDCPHFATLEEAKEYVRMREKI